MISTYTTFALSTGTAFYLLSTRTERSIGDGGLALTYAVMLPYYLGIVSEMYIMLKAGFAGLERVLQYTKLPQEPPHVLASDPKPDEWPAKGVVVFSNVSMRYRPGLPLALTDFSATIDAKQKCGIVGRTGAGKSTLILALFRIQPIDSGVITIDGLDLLSMGLRRLRSAITIIPQDPVLHMGSVAHNLDPFQVKDTDVLRDALTRAQLPESLLTKEVSKGGTNMSSGERQLLCFARALLQDSAILVLDEATSNLDESSDAKIQTLLRGTYQHHTVLTIAHRLVTVIDYDQMLVLGDGRLVEAGSPWDLLNKPDGALAAMAKALGPAGEAVLRNRCQPLTVNE